jgi:hypothetical protein
MGKTSGSGRANCTPLPGGSARTAGVMNNSGTCYTFKYFADQYCNTPAGQTDVPGGVGICATPDLVLSAYIVEVCDS